MKQKRDDDDDFVNFIEEFGEATKTIVVPEPAIQKWRGVLPEQLLGYWKNEGWNTYRNGLVNIVNPDDYEDIIDIWLEDTFLEERDSYHVIARTGFGSLYAFGQKSGRNLIIDCYNHTIYFTKTNSSSKSADDLDWEIRSFFGASEASEFDIKCEDNKWLFEQAINKHGPLDDNEIFGFEPAIILGGKKDLKYVAKVNAQVHLTLLREFADPVIYEM